MFGEVFDETRIFGTAKHVINTENTKPIYCRTSRIAIHYESQIEAEIKKDLNSGILRPSNSPLDSRIVPVTKPDGSLRMCIDYRPLNKCTIKDKYPIPCI